MTHTIANPARVHSPLVLVTGATGYIGGRLVQRLLERGFRVRVMARVAGVLGWLYWYGIYPLHARIFSDLVNAIARDAEVGQPGA